ncbi:hypothetical protein RAMLITH_22760 [Ramlibacter sp. RBP-2]|uniref:FCP1 homology domain-containing protein n=1 Tax=Ramlibacter lithotrophicus TaxID=2606681 RepID=A0A7X6DK53_9BURK|nr:HAD domain-containing protein [Ramlibacter lithotrophicus]NKE68647.1 hypothetical protein [Ramlibacter lithotrophicus]
MRVLFLDFDGVLTKVAAEGERVVLFEWLPLLAALLVPWPDVRIVVHSTWRYDHTDEELRKLLGPLAARFIGAVPRGPRAEAIRWFLYSNAAITDYLVVDDSCAEFPEDFSGPLVVCDPLFGISDARVRAAIAAWLAGGTR